MWLTPGEGRQVRVVATEKDSAGAYTVVEVARPGRRAALLVQPGHGADRPRGHEARPADDRRNAVRLPMSASRPVPSVERIIGMPANDLTVRRLGIPARRSTPRASRLRTRSNRIASSRPRPRGAAVPLRRPVWVRASVNGGEPADFVRHRPASRSSTAPTRDPRAHDAGGSRARAPPPARRFSKIKSLKISSTATAWSSPGRGWACCRSIRSSSGSGAAAPA